MSTSAEKSHLVVVLADEDNVRSQCPVKEEQRSSASASPDLESGRPGGESGRECRICHLSLDGRAADKEELRGGAAGDDDICPIELGCSCKDDLAAAHRQCAETWFKIRGNRTCEICGSIATNISGNSEAGSSGTDQAVAPPLQPPVLIMAAGPPSFWQSHRFLNFVLACVIFAFVISWLFHFNVPS